MQSEPIVKRRGAYLPHWTREGGIYAVRFRLFDSVPQEKLKEWQWEREHMLQHAQKMQRALSIHERLQLLRLHTETVEQFLRSGKGSCFLARDDIACIMADAFRYFEKDRYKLFAWCIMPNHVHAVVQPNEEHSLSQILHSWKRHTAREANKILKRTHQPFWQRESFDRLLRNEDHIRHHIEYTWGNPELAGRSVWNWRWKIEEEEFRRWISAEYSPDQRGL